MQKQTNKQNETKQNKANKQQTNKELVDPQYVLVRGKIAK